MEREWAPFWAVLAVIIGWFVVNHQHNRREDRKEARAAADRSKQLASSIATDCLSYMTEGKLELAGKIKLSLDELEVELELLPNFRIKNGPLMSRFVAFCDAATGGDFESSSPAKKSLAAIEVSALLVARNSLNSEIERQFRAYFR